jgi:hypothetical protein
MRRLAAVALLSASAAFGACSSFGSNDDGAAASSDAGSETTPPPPDPPPSPVAPDAAYLLDESFDKTNDCGKWVPQGGAAFTWQPAAGRDGGGACLVYVPGSAAVLQRVVVSADAGTIQLTAWVHDAADGGGAAYANVAAFYDDGGLGPYRTNTRALGSTYELLQVKVPIESATKSIEVDFAATVAETSYLLDDVRLEILP